jgi:hypothetical protein
MTAASSQESVTGREKLDLAPLADASGWCVVHPWEHLSLQYFAEPRGNMFGLLALTVHSRF